MRNPKVGGSNPLPAISSFYFLLRNFFMREFILYSQKGPTGPFNVKDLPGSGRVDLIARAVISALWISHKLRDNVIHISLNGPPNSPKVITITSNIRRVSPDERAIGLWINKILYGKSNPGITLRDMSFGKLIEEKINEGKNVFVLHEGGEDVLNVKDFGNPVFVVGDNIGLPDDIDGKKISIGPTSYLASQCITFLNVFLDRQSSI